MDNVVKLYLKLLPLINLTEWRAKIVELTSQFAPLLAILDSVPLPRSILKKEDIQFLESFSIEENADKAVKLFEEVLASQITLEIDLLHNCEYYLNKYKSLEDWRESIQSPLKNSQLNVLSFVIHKEQPRISVAVAPLIGVLYCYSNLAKKLPDVTKIMIAVTPGAVQ
jgi:hypothetical protein